MNNFFEEAKGKWKVTILRYFWTVTVTSITDNNERVILESKRAESSKEATQLLENFMEKYKNQEEYYFSCVNPKMTHGAIYSRNTTIDVWVKLENEAIKES